MNFSIPVVTTGNELDCNDGGYVPGINIVRFCLYCLISFGFVSIALWGIEGGPVAGVFL